MIYLPLSEGTYRISQWFGSRPKYYAKYGHKGHNGYDFAPLKQGFNTEDRIIYAPHEGYVKLHYGDIGYGNFLEVLSLPYNNEGHRKKSDLAHIFRFLVEDGQFVGSGDPVAIMGGAKGQKGSGDSTGTHLHWTYKKTDWEGKTLDKDNGYAGAIPIAPFTLRWQKQTLGE
jgi:murein DD-endopeptidase MepM/ murein hydrolase activator NlpD